MANLKEKTFELLDYVRSHGGKVSTTEVCEAFGCKINSITGRVNSLVKGGYAVYTKKTEDAPGYIELTEAGMEYEPEVEAE